MATYSEIYTLSKDAAFLGKVEVAVTKYMDYILGEPTDTVNHTHRWQWATGIATNGPGITAARISPFVAWDGTIQANLGASSDAQIQSAVEAWVNRVFQF